MSPFKCVCVRACACACVYVCVCVCEVLYTCAYFEIIKSREYTLGSCNSIHTILKLIVTK